MMLPETVERLALLGWRLYPSSNAPGSRAGCFKAATDAATHDLDILAGWARDYPRCNWRVIMQGSGIWALDCDAPGADHEADGIKAFTDLVAGRALPPRPMIRSGGGGLVLFFKHNGEKIAGKTGTPAPGIDPRRGRLSVTVPPSIHHRTRRAYRWISAPWEVSPPDAPGWLLAAVAPPPEPEWKRVQVATTDRARRMLSRAIGKVHDAGEGQRNDTLNRQGYSVARFVAAGLLGEAEAIEALYAAARHIGLSHPEIKATLQSAFRSGARNPVEASWGTR